METRLQAARALQDISREVCYQDVDVEGIDAPSAPTLRFGLRPAKTDAKPRSSVGERQLGALGPWTKILAESTVSTGFNSVLGGG